MTERGFDLVCQSVILLGACYFLWQLHRVGWL